MFSALSWSITQKVEVFLNGDFGSYRRFPPEQPISIRPKTFISSQLFLAESKSMDHIMQLEHHNLKHCNPGIAGIRRSTSVSQVAFALATFAFLSLFSSRSIRTSLSSALSAQLPSLYSFVMTKKALFVLSNAIFIFLVADCRSFFSICSLSPSSSDVTASEPNGVLAKQAQHQDQEIEQCAIQPCVSYSGSIYHNSSNIAPENYAHPARKGEESRSNARAFDGTKPSEEHERKEDIPVSSQPEVFRLDEEANSVTMETVVVEEPTCGTAQELETLEIDELNKKFEEFIQSRRIKWLKEEEACSGM